MVALVFAVPIVFFGFGLTAAARIRSRGSRIAVLMLVAVVGVVAMYAVWIELYKHGYLGPT